MRRIAIYDMDKTITERATFTPFLVHALKRHQRWRIILTPLAGLLLVLYAIRIIDRGQLKENIQRLFLGKYLSPQRAQLLRDGFVAETLARNVRADALAQIGRDKADGYELILATASFEFYASAIAHALGFNAVVATRSQLGRTGYIAAKIDGDNCYGGSKLAMVKQWLATENAERKNIYARFYSDHISDLPCFEWADEAIAISPDARLRAIANAKGWSIQNWR
jgi:HAD superfamily hydrolase (TIGR01490 family)